MKPMKPILVVVPYHDLLPIAKVAAMKYDNVDVEVGLLEKGVELCEGAEERGVEVIISRGGTVRMLKKAITTIPIVEIPVSPYDILTAVHKAKEHGENIYVVGFENMIKGVETIGPVLGAKVYNYMIEHFDEGDDFIRETLRSGKKVDAIVGGVVAENIGLKYNIPSVSLKTSVGVIEYCISEAQIIAKATRREKEKGELMKAILHNIKEGVISVDNAGLITSCNSAAVEILEFKNTDVIGMPIKKLIPNTHMLDTISSNTPQLGQIMQVGNVEIVANRVPINVRGLVGAVVTFEKVARIQEYEQKIRASFLKKGHFAKYSLEDIIGESAIIKKTKERAQKYALTNSTVLIVGESGTGKELFAQGMHLASQRRKGPFVAVNCAAIAPNLLESELFGYAEGAFTGAKKEGRTGLFAEAHEGTIFLDEIGEMGIELQARLLRVLQERVVRPVGSNTMIPIDVRVIAATNINLIKAIEEGRFRSDLYYRLNILELRVPSLTERREDIRTLVKFFVDRVSNQYQKNCSIKEEALELLEYYPWKGNVRELENLAERLVALSDGDISAGDVLDSMQGIEGVDDQKEELLDIKLSHINKVLKECNGNQSLAAKRLGISRTNLWRILKNPPK